VHGLNNVEDANVTQPFNRKNLKRELRGQHDAVTPVKIEHKIPQEEK